MVLLASCLAMLGIGINSTAIMAALPTMRTEFGLGVIGTQWTINAYLVVSASCIVLGGKAADLFGARVVSMAGLGLFGVASCVIALAGSEYVLLAGRAMQGFSAAFAVPSTLAVVGTGAAPARRAAAIGAWSGCLMLGFSIGPLFGGALTHGAGWRLIFWLNIPLMCVACVGLATAGSAQTHRDDNAVRTADWKGFMLLATAMVSTVLALQALPRVASSPLAVIAPLVLAATAFALLLHVERRAAGHSVEQTAQQARVHTEATEKAKSRRATEQAFMRFARHASNFPVIASEAKQSRPGLFRFARNDNKLPADRSSPPLHPIALRRAAAPLIDLGFFARRNFVLGVSLGAISMFGIMSLLLYFNLYAQSANGLGLTPLQSGAALLPLSAALLVVALSVSLVTARVGLRRAMMGCTGLILVASAIIGIAAAGAGILLMEIGFVVMGAGLALPYAAAPRLALSALSQEQAGQGSGIINACSFLAGSVGVAGGAIAWQLAGFPGVLAMIGVAGACGVALGSVVSEG